MSATTATATATTRRAGRRQDTAYEDSKSLASQRRLTALAKPLSAATTANGNSNNKQQ